MPLGGHFKSYVAQPASLRRCLCVEHHRPMLDKRRTVMGRSRSSPNVPSSWAFVVVVGRTRFIMHRMAKLVDQLADRRAAPFQKMVTNCGTRQSAGKKRYTRLRHPKGRPGLPVLVTVAGMRRLESPRSGILQPNRPYGA